MSFFLSQYCEEAFQNSVLNYRTQHFKTFSIIIIMLCFQRVIKLGSGGLTVRSVHSMASSSISESDSLPVTSAVQNAKVLWEPIQTTEKWRWIFFPALCVVRWPIHASMHCLWHW